MEIRFPRSLRPTLPNAAFVTSFFTLQLQFLTAQSLFIVVCSRPGVDTLWQDVTTMQIDRTACSLLIRAGNDRISGMTIQELAGAVRLPPE
jgi:hypothetical protein